MNPGDRVRVERGGVTNEGVLMPSSTPKHLVIKLDGGYNVGIARDDADVEILESDVHDIESAQSESEASEIAFDDDLPTISLISTGGTIASTVDYRTGAVTAQFDAEDVLRAVPDLAGRANYRGRVVANILSENMTPDVWQELARTVAEEIRAGADGLEGVTSGGVVLPDPRAAVELAGVVGGRGVHTHHHLGSVGFGGLDGRHRVHHVV